MGASDDGRGQRRRARAGNDELRRSVLAEVATLYYVDRLTQEQIARQLGRSVSMVSRMLAEAERVGIVEVRVRQPTPVDTEVQFALAQRFGLRVARVLRTAGAEPQAVLQGVGELAARYLSAILHDGVTLTIGWGTALYETARALPATPLRDVHVAQSLGSLGSRLPQIDNHLITRMVAERLHATPHYLPAPMIVESEGIREALVQDPQIRETLAVGRRAQIGLVGIGVPEPGYAGMLRAGYVDAATLESIRATGAVGDILVSFFDAEGRIRDLPISNRVIGMRLADLTALDNVIAVAAGAYKAHAILGALRLGLIHVLVIDDATARRVLELADRGPHAMGGVDENDQDQPADDLDGKADRTTSRRAAARRQPT